MHRASVIASHLAPSPAGTESCAAEQVPTFAHVERQSSLFPTLLQKGAVPGTVNNGYSEMLRCMYFPQPGESMEQARDREYKACRGGVACWDMSSFVKIRIEGPDAASELERLCTLKIDRPIQEGKLVYCCLSNPDGGIAADITCLREGAQTFYMVGGAELLKTMLTYFKKNFRPSARVVVTDVTAKVGVLHIAGPLSRKVLQKAAPLADLSNAAHPFSFARVITLGDDPTLAGDGVRVTALRISFMGDLGWELHCAMEDLPTVYRLIHAAGKEHGLIDAGYACIGPLRTERMFLHWVPEFRKGGDLTPAEIPAELGMIVKKSPFQGREAIVARRKAGIRKRFVSIVVADPKARLTGMEELRRDGKKTGWVATGAFTPGLGKAVGIGWVQREGAEATWDWILAKDAKYTVATDGGEFDCTILQHAAFDPKGARSRADA